MSMLDRALMTTAKTMPDRLVGRLLATRARFRPNTIIRRKDDHWVVSIDREQWAVPAAHHTLRLTDIGDVPLQRVWRKYQHENYRVVPGDTVVDVGAFIGEFTRVAAREAERVIAVEPDPRARACLERNVGNEPNVEIVDAVIGELDATTELNLAGDPTESSVLRPDRGRARSTESVDSLTLETLADEYDLDGIDFLKIDAEGAEPEVLKSIGECPVTKIAVDLSPERDGSSPIPQVGGWMTGHRYDYNVRSGMIYAHKPADRSIDDEEVSLRDSPYRY